MIFLKKKKKSKKLCSRYSSGSNNIAQFTETGFWSSLLKSAFTMTKIIAVNKPGVCVCLWLNLLLCTYEYRNQKYQNILSWREVNSWTNIRKIAKVAEEYCTQWLTIYMNLLVNDAIPFIEYLYVSFLLNFYFVWTKYEIRLKMPVTSLWWELTN